MKRHFFINKMNTIFKDSSSNFGFSPVIELNYGKDLSRVLIKPDINELVNLVKEKDIIDIKSARHILHMTNCSSLSNKNINEKVIGVNGRNKRKASSFDIILFKLPRNFDQGNGSALYYDNWTENDFSFSEDGSNWFQAKNNDFWEVNEDTDMGIEGLGNGIYKLEYLEKSFDDFINGKDSIVFATQHFDTGNEDLNIDITDFINSAIENEVFFKSNLKEIKEGEFEVSLEETNNKKNDPYFGFGMAFAPVFEKEKKDVTNYVSFFSGKTNSFFHPYIETILETQYKDDRNKVIKGKKNCLYLYCNDNGSLVNLDNLPKCSIEGIVDDKIRVYQAGKGVYCAEISEIPSEWDNYTLHYDLWSNLALNGISIEPQELSFTVYSNNPTISFSEVYEKEKSVVPIITGIKDGETILTDEIINIGIILNKKYAFGEKEFVDNIQYRIKSKVGNSMIKVFDFTNIDIMNGDYSFLLNANDFVPGEYFIDIKVFSGRGQKIFENVGRFKKENDTTEMYK